RLQMRRLPLRSRLQRLQRLPLRRRLRLQLRRLWVRGVRVVLVGGGFAPLLASSGAISVSKIRLFLAGLGWNRAWCVACAERRRNGETMLQRPSAFAISQRRACSAHDR